MACDTQVRPAAPRVNRLTPLGACLFVSGAAVLGLLRFFLAAFTPQGARLVVEEQPRTPRICHDSTACIFCKIKVVWGVYVQNGALRD